jgi:hypothetical protein
VPVLQNGCQPGNVEIIGGGGGGEEEEIIGYFNFYSCLEGPNNDINIELDSKILSSKFPEELKISGF